MAGCDHKQCYATEDEARFAAAFSLCNSDTGIKALYIYRCPIHLCFHLSKRRSGGSIKVKLF